ncbi:hypothetical protein L581_3154 [Serratia fonticola AU-AP2C]|nr:hypothetical protein L581_3154 [Serratia fonticola AU-AP2C]
MFASLSERRAVEIKKATHKRSPVFFDLHQLTMLSALL